MKNLKKPFGLPTTINAAKQLLQALKKHKRDIIKSHCSNQATSYQEHELEFIAIHIDKFGTEKKTKKIFPQKEEINRMMQYLPKLKSKGNSAITSAFILLPTTKEELD